MHGFVDHLDALVEQGGVHELDLLGGQVDLGQHLGDVFGRDEAPAPAQLDEPVDFLDIDYPAFGAGVPVNSPLPSRRGENLRQAPGET